MLNKIRTYPGLIWGIAFLLFASGAFAYFLATGNGFAFFALTIPWGWLLPEGLTNSANFDTWVYPTSWALILLNAFALWQLRKLWLLHKQNTNVAA